MKENRARRWISFLLTAVMLLSLIPAAVVPAAAATTEDNYHRILHLDCGRKYFSKDWIKALINEMEAAGYNQLQLAFGNDGLRFLLDDMSFEANGTAYSHATVVSKVEAGNEAQNDSGDASWLTQDEMDEIIEHANSCNIEIIPLLNLPGHANAILDIVDDAYNASGSNNTLDVANNDAAVEFGYAIFQKYVDYFAAKGCKYFNFGADEYANDADGYYFSFSRLNSTQYQKFVAFINQLASYIKDKGMTPRSFNDGLYYNNQSADIDTNIQCCYWSSGWGSYPVASASTISGKGHDMINTNGDFYYVLGKDDQFDSSYSYASNFSNTAFMSSTISDPVGSMFCIWCDYPNAETEQEVAQKTRMPLRAMAARMQDKDITTIADADTIVSGGFNADGTINTTDSMPDLGGNSNTTAPTLTVNGTTYTTEQSVSLDLAANGSSTLELGNVGDKDVTASSNNESVATASYDKAKGEVTVTAVGGGEATITITVADAANASGIATFADDAATFSVNVTVAAANDAANTVDVTLEVGQTSEAYDTAAIVGTVTMGDNYIATGTITAGETTATSVTKVTSITSGRKYLLYNNRYQGVLTNTSTNEWDSQQDYYGLKLNKDTPSATNNNWWLITKTESSYTIQYQGGEYLTIGNNTSALASATANITLNYNSNGQYWTIHQNGYYMNNLGESAQVGGWNEDRASTDAGSKWTLYEITEASSGDNQLTFTGVGEGSTTATVGGTTYNITVTAPQTEEKKTLICGSELDLPAGATDVSVSSSAVTYANGKLTAGQTAGSATVTFVTKNEGGKVTKHYTYTINVAAEDLSTVTPLIIEYWITNSDEPTDASGNNTKSVSASDAYSAEGKDVTTILPAHTTKDNRDLDFWRCRLLDTTKSNSSTSKTEKQTGDAGDDETLSGVGFTKVRYYNSTWAVYTENEEWVTVESKHQLVAYYLEIVPIKNANGNTEVNVNAADWGTKGDGSSSWGYNPETNRCSVSIQIVYEDGSTNPAGTTATSLKSKTILYGYWDGGRGLGTMLFNGAGDYQIYKVTAETGTMSSSTSGQTVTVDDFKWNNDAETVWEGDPSQSVSIHNSAKTPDYTAPYDNLTWNTGSYNSNNAILIRVYVKTVETESNVKVVYYDEQFNAELYSYFIDVPAGTTFNSDIVDSKETKVSWDNINNMKDSTTRKDVSGYGIQNKNAQYQWFQTDLTQVPEAVGKYHSDLYTYKGSELKDEGMTLYLYYSINTEILKPNFVADFGLPIQFPLSDLVNAGDTVETVTVIEETKYGKLTYDKTNERFTYTPTTTIKDYDVLSITLTIAGKTATTNVGVTAASNVLYEDSFLTENTAHNYKAWTKGTAATTTQEAQKAGETANVFGYDEAYKESTGNSMDSAWTISGLSSGNASKYLTTSFYGNGFDLIGTAGPNTGYVYLLLKGPTSKLVIIDTSYAHGTLYQVPLAHVDGLTEGTYEVSIRAAYRPAKTATTAAASTYGLNSSDPMEDVYAVMDELYQDGFEIDDIEVVGVDEAAVASTLSAETATQATAQAGTTVTIDGFRVYRSSSNESYPTVERDVTYVNVLDAALSGDSFTAYTESKTGEWTQTDYESNGGPQNEVYLAEDNAIAFKVKANAEVQISARAVSGTAKLVVNGTEIQTLTSNTEMYYTVTADESGIITIKNTGTGMLALGNLKLPAGTATQSLTAEDQVAVVALLSMAPTAPVEPEEPETSVFTPEKLDVNVKSLNVIRNKLVTLTVTTSTDVASLTVNGKTVKPTNSWLVKMGWSDEYVYVLADKVKRSESKTYEVIAYNADGAASAVQTVTG